MVLSEWNKLILNSLQCHVVKERFFRLLIALKFQKNITQR